MVDVPEVVTVAPEFTDVPEVTAEVAAELVDAEYEYEVSASSITVDTD
jgi:hypothetical protein